jgi:Sulfotransferase family
MRLSMPNFFIIGAPSCGTTSLHAYLRQHPQVFMSPAKEPHFFSFAEKEFESVPLKSGTYQQAVVRQWQEYQALFQGVRTETAIGEASASYIYSPGSARRIHQYNPQAKIIAILRDPTERAYSNYIRCVRDGHEPLADFAQALSQESIRIEHNWSPKWFYKLKGFYHQQLNEYFHVFSREQMLLCLHEDLSQMPETLMQTIFEFLGVDPMFVPDMSTRKNQSVVPKNTYLQSFLDTRNPLKSMLKRVIPQDMYRQTASQLRHANLVKPQLPPQIRQQLVSDYREDILRLQDLMGRDLSAWLQY